MGRNRNLGSLIRSLCCRKVRNKSNRTEGEVDQGAPAHKRLRSEAQAVVIDAGDVDSDDGRVATVTKNGIEIKYDAFTPYNGWWATAYEEWESDTFELFDRFFDKDSVVLDVGAWVGPTALYAGYKSKAVVALEPSPRAFWQLSANLDANLALSSKVTLVQAALDSQDRIAPMTGIGNALDMLVNESNDVMWKSQPNVEKIVSYEGTFFDVRALTIDTLVRENPILKQTSFVKIDTEGYEGVIVPAMEQFFRECRPVTMVSLHPWFISHEAVQKVVDVLRAVFPYLYEVDMKTPFNPQRSSYTYGDHGGADVLCTWSPLHVARCSCDRKPDRS